MYDNDNEWSLPLPSLIIIIYHANFHDDYDNNGSDDSLYLIYVLSLT